MSFSARPFLRLGFHRSCPFRPRPCIVAKIQISSHTTTLHTFADSPRAQGHPISPALGGLLTADSALLAHCPTLRCQIIRTFAPTVCATHAARFNSRHPFAAKTPPNSIFIHSSLTADAAGLRLLPHVPFSTELSTYLYNYSAPHYNTLIPYSIRPVAARLAHLSRTTSLRLLNIIHPSLVTTNRDPPQPHLHPHHNRAYTPSQPQQKPSSTAAIVAPQRKLPSSHIATVQPPELINTSPPTSKKFHSVLSATNLPKKNFIYFAINIIPFYSVQLKHFHCFVVKAVQREVFGTYQQLLELYGILWEKVSTFTFGNKNSRHGLIAWQRIL